MTIVCMDLHCLVKASTVAPLCRPALCVHKSITLLEYTLLADGIEEKTLISTVTLDPA